MDDLNNSDTTPDVTGSQPDSGGAPASADSSTAEGSVTPARPGDSPEGVNTQPSDQTAQTETAEQDIFAGIPSLEELEKMKTQGVDLAAGLHQMRSTLEPLSAQHKELSAKFQPYEQFTQTPEDLQSLVTLNESLNKYSPDPETGALRPDPTGFAQQISTEDPQRADYLTSALIWGTTNHPGTGQPVTRAELVLQVMASDPELRARALETLGGVEPSAVPAPSWTPSQEELDKINDPEYPTAEGRALQEVYKKLSYEERDELKLASPEFMKGQLRMVQQNQLLQANEERRVAGEQQAQVQAEQRYEQEANAAGDTYVEQGFREGLTTLANHIYETYKPTDDPATNRKEGAQVVLSVVALSHPDTRWAGELMLKEMGVNPADLEPLNQSRESYAKAGREFGYLTHKKQRVTGEDPVRAQQRMLVQGQNLATKIIAGRNAYFTGRARSHNDNLDQTERARIPIGGSPATTGNGAGNRYLQAGKRTEAEIYGT